MSRTQKATFSVLFIIKKSKLLKNGEAPICMRITVRGQIAEIMVKRSVPVPSWNQAKECSKGKDYISRELNHYLETVKARIYQIQRELEIDGITVTAYAIKNRYLGNDDLRKTICELYKEHNEKCRSLIGVDYTASTVSKFDTSFSHIKEFIRHQYGKSDVLLADINAKFMNDFDFYLKTVKKCRQNSSIKHLKILKKVIRIALANDWIKKDPFINIRFKHEETDIEFLSEEELTAVINKDFSIERLALVRDVFVFCCYTNLW